MGTPDVLDAMSGIGDAETPTPHSSVQFCILRHLDLEVGGQEA